MSPFSLSEEQQLLQDAARAFLTEEASTAVLRRLRDGGDASGFDPSLWSKIVELGWTGVLIPEEHGGSPLGFKSMGLLLEAAGRTLAPLPLLSTALIAPTALLRLGSSVQQGRWLPRIVAGEALFALAIDESAHHAPARTALRAEPAAEGWRLSGRKAYVVDGQAAQLLLVVARRPEGDLGLFLAAAEAPGVTRKPLVTIDGRGAADIHFAGTPAEALAEGGPEGLEAVLDAARAGLAAEMLGQAQQAFEVTAEYLRTRTQFGQVIGAFQALQHRAAKMLVDLELTRSVVLAALAALDAGRADAPRLASMAKARAGETLHLVSNEMVQLHGGIGMTDAHDAGLYLKRARVAEALYGSAAFHRDRYAALQGY